MREEGLIETKTRRQLQPHSRVRVQDSIFSKHKMTMELKWNDPGNPLFKAASNFDAIRFIDQIESLMIKQKWRTKPIRQQCKVLYKVKGVAFPRMNHFAVDLSTLFVKHTIKTAITFRHFCLDIQHAFCVKDGIGYARVGNRTIATRKCNFVLANRDL